MLLAAVVILSFASCSKERKTKEVDHQKMGEHGMTVDWKFTLPKGDPSEGRKVFVEAECYKCHEAKGETFAAVAAGERGAGPELSQVAGMHPPEFFAESIINPNVVIDPKGKELGYLGEDGKSKMPDYTAILTVKQVSDLVAYLSSLNKTGGHTAH
jgi:mono/diheme cytochrome c family protein